MTYFIRTENGIAANVTKAEGLAEANRCMMDGKREVATMTATTDMYMIWYKDGRRVYLSRQTGDMPEPATKVDGSKGRKIVTVKGRQYVVSVVTPARPKVEGVPTWVPEAYVSYWFGGPLGLPSGPTRTAKASMRPGTVGRAIWEAVNA